MKRNREKITDRTEAADIDRRLRAEQVWWDNIARILEESPPLTQEQIDEITAITQPILRRMRDAA